MGNNEKEKNVWTYVYEFFSLFSLVEHILKVSLFLHEPLCISCAEDWFEKSGPFFTLSDHTLNVYIRVHGQIIAFINQIEIILFFSVSCTGKKMAGIITQYRSTWYL